LIVEAVKAISTEHASQDDLYKEAVEKYGPALQRLAAAYEVDPDKRRDLAQEIHFQLWRSFQLYGARCSLRTWVYRVAHHTATSYVMRERRVFSALVSLEEIETFPDKEQTQLVAEQRINVTRLSTLIQRLKPLDRQVIVCWLEGLDAASIAEITGLSPGSVAMRVHRIKNILAQWFDEGVSHAK
jgi:RNA polymerase sigma-70 factor (ECF subfamily)